MNFKEALLKKQNNQNQGDDQVDDKQDTMAFLIVQNEAQIKTLKTALEEATKKLEEAQSKAQTIIPMEEKKQIPDQAIQQSINALEEYFSEDETPLKND